MKQEFQIGDLVRIKESTHDRNLPENRLGLIVKKLSEPMVEGSGIGSRTYTYIWVVMMTNGKSLRFHEMFLEHTPKENEK
jgi:hypothetical protein